MKNTLSFGIALTALGMMTAEPLAAQADGAVPAQQTAAIPQPPAFHADWTAEEQAKLLHLRRLVSKDFPEMLKKEFNQNAKGLGIDPLAPEEEDVFDDNLRLWCNMLDEVIAGGVKSLAKAKCRFGESDIPLSYTPQGVAAFVGDMDALKMLIGRGADPNAGLYNEKENRAIEVPLASVLAGGCQTAGYASLGIADRLAVADWLLEHGADPRYPGVAWDAFLYVGIKMSSRRPHMEILQWAQEHKVDAHDFMIKAIMKLNGTMDNLKRELEEHPGCVQKPLKNGRTLLAELMESDAEDMEEKARYLLEKGASATTGKTKPMDALLLAMRWYSDENGESLWKRQMAVMELLMEHGARPRTERQALPVDARRAEQVRDLIGRMHPGLLKQIDDVIHDDEVEGDCCDDEEECDGEDVEGEGDLDEEEDA